MDHPEKTHQLAQRAPNQIIRVIAQRDARFSIDRTGCFEKVLFQAEPIPQLGLVSVEGAPPALFAWAGEAGKYATAFVRTRVTR